MPTENWEQAIQNAPIKTENGDADGENAEDIRQQAHAFLQKSLANQEFSNSQFEAVVSQTLNYLQTNSAKNQVGKEFDSIRLKFHLTTSDQAQELKDSLYSPEEKQSREFLSNIQDTLSFEVFEKNIQEDIKKLVFYPTKENILSLQSFLNLDNESRDGVFGPQTHSAFTKYMPQSLRGIKELDALLGTKGEISKAYLDEIEISKIIKEGLESATTLEKYSLENLLSFPDEANIKMLQKKIGLEKNNQDGIFGDKSLIALKKYFAAVESPEAKANRLEDSTEPQIFFEADTFSSIKEGIQTSFFLSYDDKQKISTALDTAFNTPIIRNINALKRLVGIGVNENCSLRELERAILYRRSRLQLGKNPETIISFSEVLDGKNSILSLRALQEKMNELPVGEKLWVGRSLHMPEDHDFMLQHKKDDSWELEISTGWGLFPNCIQFYNLPSATDIVQAAYCFQNLSVSSQKNRYYSINDLKTNTSLYPEAMFAQSSIVPQE